ncbi:MAG: L-asparaginase 1 [Candidatus Taylorbacteria bacterium]|nr:L-asparaginase 1 [Candidatus Taylorbacteria bacterium]
MKPRITFITTGGTYDKDYAIGAGSYDFIIADSAIPQVLAPVNPNFDSEIISLLRKDSTDITDADRKLIFDACAKAASGKIIITHGTDTMTETAKVLSAIEDKTIILTGSSKPQSFKVTDAEFNLGMAVAAVQTLQAGVYIIMSGRIYPWDGCRKDPKTGQFVEKF